MQRIKLSWGLLVSKVSKTQRERKEKAFGVLPAIHTHAGSIIEVFAPVSYRGSF